MTTNKVSSIKLVEMQDAIKKYLEKNEFAPLFEKELKELKELKDKKDLFEKELKELKRKRHWIVEKDPDLTYKFTKVSTDKNGCFILPNGTNSKDLVIGLIIKLESQDLHYRSWHNILVKPPKETPSDSTKHDLRESLNPWITSKIKPESYWFSKLYKVEVDDKKRSLPCFTLYISKSYEALPKNSRFLKFNRHLRRAQKSALMILNEEYKAELKIREKNPRLKKRKFQWDEAIKSIKRALSRSIDGWRIDDTNLPVLFDPRDDHEGKILANGDLISGYITLKQEGKPKEPEVRYIVIIKNEDLINGCESREKFLSERYAALIFLINGNKDEKLPIFDGLIEVFSLQDKRKDLWKRHLNLTEFHPDERYNPISLLVEMGGDRFYEPILVYDEKAYSSFVEEMTGSSSDKKNKKGSND